MRDPDIDIENEGVKELRKAKIEVEDFPGELNQKIRLSLKEFIEFKEAEKLKKTKERKKKEAKPYLKQATKIVVNGNEKGVISGFSNKAIQQFISNSKATFNYPSKDFNNWAIGFELVTKTGKNMVATKIGLLLFGEEVDEIYSHSIFKVEIDYEDGKSEIKNITEPISLQLPKLMKILKDKALKLTIDRSDAKRIEHIDFPTEILREVIANAIIHRDYSIEGANNYIYISKDKIVVEVLDYQ